jgi:RNA polymerase sigma factor (TIGR02999 family)
MRAGSISAPASSRGSRPRDRFRQWREASLQVLAQKLRQTCHAASMTSSPDPDRQAITDALAAARDGGPGAVDRIFPLVYEQLHRLAHRQLQSESPGHTLSTTALIHEAYLKLVDERGGLWQDRAYFFAVAAGAMRRILVDHARRHRAARRGGGAQTRLALDEVEIPVTERAAEIVALDEALQRLAALDSRQAKVVECRYFAGLTETETAEALGISVRTVAREWVTAKGWLYQEMHDGSD